MAVEMQQRPPSIRRPKSMKRKNTTTSKPQPPVILEADSAPTTDSTPLAISPTSTQPPLPTDNNDVFSAATPSPLPADGPTSASEFILQRSSSVPNIHLSLTSSSSEQIATIVVRHKRSQTVMPVRFLLVQLILYLLHLRILNITATHPFVWSFTLRFFRS